MTAETQRTRFFYRMPLFGRIARDVVEGDGNGFWYLLAVLVAVLVLAVTQWGLPALVLPAVVLAPVVLLLLVVMTRG